MPHSIELVVRVKVLRLLFESYSGEREHDEAA